jgi:hypothetical protein
MLFGTQGQRLHNPGIRLAALPELLQGEAVVVVLVHLVEDLVDSLLGRVLVLGRLLALQPTKSEHTFSHKRYCVFNLVVGRKILWYFKLKICGVYKS